MLYLDGDIDRVEGAMWMRVIAYIDGFNFYYACFTHQQYAEDGARQTRDPLFDRLQRAKWVDLRALIERCFPDDEIVAVNYFSARVGATPDDPNKAGRQHAYLRALAATGTDVHLSQFKKRTKPARLRTRVPCQANPICIPELVYVTLREEKGSDVFLASSLVRDAFQGNFDRAVVVSNDSDLAPAVRIAVEEAGKDVAVLSPYRRLSRTLAAAASSIQPLDRELILACQLPDEIPLRGGKVLRKPLGW